MTYTIIAFDTEYIGFILLAVSLAVCKLDERGFPIKLTTKTYRFYRKEHREKVASSKFWSDNPELLKKLRYKGNQGLAEMYNTAAKKIIEQIEESKKIGKVIMVAGSTTDTNALMMLGEEFSVALYNLDRKFQDVVILRSLYSSYITLKEDIRDEEVKNPYKTFSLKNPTHRGIIEELSKIIKRGREYKLHDPKGDALITLILFLAHKYCSSGDPLMYIRELISGSVSISN